jgi:hypothetical protein
MGNHARLLAAQPLVTAIMAALRLVLNAIMELLHLGVHAIVVLQQPMEPVIPAALPEMLVTPVPGPGSRNFCEKTLFLKGYRITD